MKIISIIILSILLISFAVAIDIRINEMELNPKGSDAGNEWVELFSDDEIDLEGYQLLNGDGDFVNLSGKGKGFIVVEFNSQFLDNRNENLTLLFNNFAIDATPSLTDSENNEQTWNFCDGEWLFLDSSKGKENNCPIAKQEFLRGDANVDKKVNTEDIIFILNALFLEKGEFICEDAADADDDGQLNVADAIFISNFLFQDGKDIPEPYLEAGQDLTEDDLGCEKY